MHASQILQDGSQLEILVDEYADRFLVLITQLGKIGTLVSIYSTKVVVNA
jgi:hypothetical protein